MISTAPHAIACASLVSWVEAVPDRFFDHTITDPPYLEHTHTSQRRGSGTWSAPRPVGFDSLTPELRREYAYQIARVTKGWAIVFTDAEGWDGWRQDFIAAGWQVPRQLMWVRGALDLDEAGDRALRGRKGAPQFTGDRPAYGHETMILAHGPRRMRWNGRGAKRDGTGGNRGAPGTVYMHEIESEGRLHPTQKPLSLLRELVRDYTAPGDRIFDPMCGAGTTNLAAKLEGRRSRGLDHNPAHAAAAARRLGVDLEGAAT